MYDPSAADATPCKYGSPRQSESDRPIPSQSQLTSAAVPGAPSLAKPKHAARHTGRPARWARSGQREESDVTTLRDLWLTTSRNRCKRKKLLSIILSCFARFENFGHFNQRSVLSIFGSVLAQRISVDSFDPYCATPVFLRCGNTTESAGQPVCALNLSAD